MKKVMTVVAVLAMLTLIGCGVDRIVDAWELSNPDGERVMIDDDGDGVAEAWGYDTNGDGESDVEIPETRKQIAAVELADVSTAELLKTLAMIGVPFAGIAGAFIGRFKPAKRLASAEVRFKGLVASVQKVKDGGTLSPDDWKKFTDVLQDVQKAVPGLQDAIAAARTELKAEEAVPKTE